MPRRRSIDADVVISQITTLTAANGCVPSLRELAAACDFASARSLYRYLDELEAAGRITWARGQHRSLRVLGVAPDRGGRPRK
jgi:SOS-response transcriptional repressor LexA